MGSPPSAPRRLYRPNSRTGLDFGFGLTITGLYGETTTDRYQTIGGGQRLAVIYQREWPSGQLRFSRPFARRAVCAARARCHAARATGLDHAADHAPPSSRSSRTRRETSRPNWASPSATASRSRATSTSSSRRRRATDRLTLLDQADLNGSLSYAFPLPRALSRVRKLARSSFSVVVSKATQCLIPRSRTRDCQVISDTRRQEYRGQHRYRYHLHPDSRPAARVYRERLPQPGPQELPAVPGRFTQPVALCRRLSMMRFRLTGSLVAAGAARRPATRRLPRPAGEFDGAAAHAERRDAGRVRAAGPRHRGARRMAAWLDSLAARQGRFGLHPGLGATSPSKGDKALAPQRDDAVQSRRRRIASSTSRTGTRGPTADKSINPDDQKKPIAGRQRRRLRRGGAARHGGRAQEDAARRSAWTCCSWTARTYGSFEDSTETLHRRALLREEPGTGAAAALRRAVRHGGRP